MVSEVDMDPGYKLGSKLDTKVENVRTVQSSQE